MTSGTDAPNAPVPVAVLGAGSWGTALALLVARGNHRVQLWAHRADHVAALTAERENARYLPGIDFPDNLQVAADLDTVAAGAVDIVSVVPSHAFASTLEDLVAALHRHGRDESEITLTWGTKGFEPGTGALFDDVAKRVAPNLRCRAVVSGPTFAAEVARGLPAAMTIAGSDSAEVARLGDLFRNDQMRIYPNPDFVGVQTAGAIKNVMAIATGISDGLGLGANARAALITRGMAELVRLGARLGGRPETFMGLAGMGDLVLTCTDDQSRNRRVGLGLGRGESLDEIKRSIGQEAEGLNTCRELTRMAERLDIAMPVTDEVYRVAFEGVTAVDAVRALMSREPRAE